MKASSKKVSASSARTAFLKQQKAIKAATALAKASAKAKTAQDEFKKIKKATVVAGKRVSASSSRASFLKAKRTQAVVLSTATAAKKTRAQYLMAQKQRKQKEKASTT